MLPLTLMTAPQLAQQVAARVRAGRLHRAWTQQELADRSGMSLSSLRRFERTGEIAFLSLVRIAIALDAVDGLGEIFPDRPGSLDELLSPPTRKRGRRS
jgi:transcriptional regulator with XRE-family HTH domain